MIKISKELLCGAMGVKKEDIVDFRVFGEELRYYEKCLIGFDCNCRISKRKDSICKCINIYKLAHKCKEWAFNNGYELRSGRDIDVKEDFYYFCEYKQERQLDYVNGDYFLADTEVESIIKACEWILGKIKEGN